MDWAGLISQVGFPIAVSVWLLARLGATRSAEIQAMA